MENKPHKKRDVTQIAVIAIAIGVALLSVYYAATPNTQPIQTTNTQNYGTAVNYSNTPTSQEPAVSQETPAVTEEPQESEESKIAGTYTVTDKLNDTWVFKLNDDETATVQEKGSDTISYASWDDNNSVISISFDKWKPRIIFPDGDVISACPKIRDGYLYVDYSAADSKNPERRLKITKTN